VIRAKKNIVFHEEKLLSRKGMHQIKPAVLKI